MVGEVLAIRPDAVTGHVEPVRPSLAPFGCLGGLAPVVSYAHGLPALQLAYGHVPVQASVAVVAGPLDHDGIVEVQPPADLECELGEVALDLRNEAAGAH